MKIERVNEHQIRCTLTREDLANRQIKISELAYGTDKAKDLFRDMMQQASFQFGFDAEDIPLMIEAIPINAECIVLIITKVDDPEELDTRFSNFAPSVHDEDSDDDLGFEADDDVMGLFHRLQQGDLGSYEDNGDEPAVPSRKTKEKAGSIKVTTTSSAASQTYAFNSLHDVSKFAAVIKGKYTGRNTLYKSEGAGKYYLILHRDDMSQSVFDGICSILTEYGQTQFNSRLGQQYLDEHFEVVIADNALQVLGDL
jgi:adapter protein MecA 1/2